MARPDATALELKNWRSKRQDKLTVPQIYLYLLPR